MTDLLPSFPAPVRRMRWAALALAGVMALSACGRQHSGEPQAVATAEMAPPAAPVARMAAMDEKLQATPAPAGGGSETAMPRYLAIRQDLQVEVPPEKLADAWGQVRNLCGSLRCELLSSSLQRETPQQPGGAMLELRVAPEDVDKLMAGVAGVARVVSHNTTSEDKTSQVIDVEARIKNRTEFRDSLRTMLRDTSTKRTMADLLQIQRTLADTQAELDASATQRKTLEQQTSKQHIQIQFTPIRALVGGDDGTFSPMARALRNAGGVLAESVAALITFAAAALPWVVVGLPLLWVLRLLWRRRRAAKA